MSGGLSLEYRPAGPVAARFLGSTAFVKEIMGPFGSGKSTVCVFCILRSLMRQPPSPIDGVARARWVIVRNTYPELRTTTMETWKQWVPPTIGDFREHGPPRHVLDLKIGRKRCQLEVLFMALDSPEDIKHLLSLELTGAWINEAREVPKEVIDTIRGRIGRWPRAVDGGCAAPQLILDTNPPDTDHYLYSLFEEEKPEGFEIFKQPSGLSPEAENLANLPPGYYENLCIGQSKQFIQVYVHGQYGYSQSGLPVFGDDYNDSLHCAAEPLKPVRGIPLIPGLDAGLTPAATFWQPMPNGQWRGLAEIVTLRHGKVGPTRFAEAINQLLGSDRFEGIETGTGWADPSSQYGIDDAAGEQSWMRIVAAKTGLTIKPAPTNGLTPRLDAVREALKRMIDGHTPGLIICPTMRVTRKGFISGYRYRRRQTSSGPTHDDQPEKNEYSHPHDGSQYAILGGGGYAALTQRQDARRRGRQVLQTEGGLDPAGW